VTDQAWLEEVRFSPEGLVPVVAQSATTGEVLMLAWANREALARTQETGAAHYWSRSRNRLWRKGETSGHHQAVVEVRLDCDGDAVRYRVRQEGPACHEGTPTCFSREVTSDGALSPRPEAPPHLLARLAALIADRDARRPEGSYTAKLLDKGLGRVSQKVGEEAVEVVVAAHSEDGPRLASEAADLLYHLLVLLQLRGVPLDAVLGELEKREK
jgi:phosphoribosyl-AMP cyclohydrolase / phosphoribosyl-ATP pyrophosphohydrolase